MLLSPCTSGIYCVGTRLITIIGVIIIVVDLVVNFYVSVATFVVLALIVETFVQRCRSGETI